MATTELLERDAELATITDQWRRARSRSGSMVLVGGESGIGKTELVRTFAEGVAGETRVAWGACDPLHTPRPLGPFHDAADELGGRVPELLAVGGVSHEVVFQDRPSIDGVLQTFMRRLEMLYPRLERLQPLLSIELPPRSPSTAPSRPQPAHTPGDRALRLHRSEPPNPL